MDAHLALVKIENKIFSLRRRRVMLANVIKSDVAVRASIQVVRAFVHLRRSILNQEAIVRQLVRLDFLQRDDLYQ